MKHCDACGKPPATISISGTLLCDSCAPSVRAEIAATEATGNKCSVSGIARRMLKSSIGAADVLLRDIPRDLTVASKQRALVDGTTMRAVWIAAMRAYLEANHGR